MVQEGQDWRSIGVAAGGALALGLGLLALRARRRPKTLRQRLAEEIDVRSALESLRQAMGEVREYLPEDGRVVRQVMEHRLKPLAAVTRRELPKRTRRAIKQLEAEREHLTKVLEREVAPTTQRLAQEALREAEELLGIARQRAEAVTGRARQELPGRARERAGTVLGVVGQVAPIRARRRGGRLRVRTQAAREVPGRLLSRIGRAAQETAAIGFWAGAAGALVYFGLLNDEQRARVRQAVSTAWAQIQDLWADFQGEDTAFADLSR